LVQAVLGFLLVAVNGEFVAENGLEIAHAEPEAERQFRFFQMNGEKGLVLVEGKIDFVAAVDRVSGSRWDEHEKHRAIDDRPGDFLGPLVAGLDALVVPYVDAGLVETRDLLVDHGGVLVRIAYEDIGFVPLVGLERRDDGDVYEMIASG
jgi:hypothetical protein